MLLSIHLSRSIFRVAINSYVHAREEGKSEDLRESYLKVDPGVLQELDGVMGVHVLAFYTKKKRFVRPSASPPAHTEGRFLAK